MAEKKPKKPLTRKKKQEIEEAKKARAAAPRMELDEIKNLEEPIYLPPTAKAKNSSPGRPKNGDYLPYEEAKAFVRSEFIPSRRGYFDWWDRNKPKSIPHYPYRVYKEWTSWNDWLGNNNQFVANVPRSWRPFEEAVQWAQKLKIETFAKWLDFCREHRDDIPEDIPLRPDLIYQQWRTWGYWLGNKPVEIVNAAQEAAKTQIFFVTHDPRVPENVFNFGVEPGGQTAFKERWEREKFNIIRIFWYDPEQGEQVKKIVNSLSTPYLDNDRQRICPNVWEINYWLEMTLQRIVRF